MCEASTRIGQRTGTRTASPDSQEQSTCLTAPMGRSVGGRLAESGIAHRRGQPWGRSCAHAARAFGLFGCAGDSVVGRRAPATSWIDVLDDRRVELVVRSADRMQSADVCRTGYNSRIGRIAEYCKILLDIAQILSNMVKY